MGYPTGSQQQGEEQQVGYRFYEPVNRKNKIVISSFSIKTFLVCGQELRALQQVSFPSIHPILTPSPVKIIRTRIRFTM